jgi:alkylhydroperoxidase family enzyme
VSRGATEEQIEKVGAYETSDLPDRTKAALRLADHLSGEPGPIDEPLYAELRRWFSEDQILDLGMCLAFATGWQRFIEAVGIVPDWWRDGSAPPWEAR